MGIYNIIEDPLTIENLGAIINNYCEGHTMYSTLTRCHINNKVTARYNIDDCNKFYIKLFNEWKKAILIQAQRNDLSVDHLNKFRLVYKYIKDKNPTTKQDVVNLLDYELMKNSSLKDALQELRFNRIGEYSGWDHFHSNFIHYGLSENQTVKHRLYLNLDSNVIHKFMKLFISKCNKNNLPFYFKFDEFAERDDTIVIFSDTKYLTKYIELLKEVKKELNIDDSIHKPPVLTGVIDGFIGYGSEPNKDKSSFNEVRSKHLEKCIKDEGINWIKRNLNATISFNTKKITYRDYLINGIVDMLIEHASKNARDDDNYLKVMGYQKKDINNTIVPMIRKVVDNNLNSIINDNNFYLKIPFKKGYLTIDSYLIENAMKKQIKFISNNSKSFNKDLLNRIHVTASSYGIDPNNYACDIYLLNELKESESIKKLKPTSNIRNDNYKTKREDKRGIIYYTPMSDKEIIAARERLGIRI